jgi:hypothetical protein
MRNEARFRIVLVTGTKPHHAHEFQPRLDPLQLVSVSNLRRDDSACLLFSMNEAGRSTNN